jgi:hypothetical protein
MRDVRLLRRSPAVRKEKKPVAKIIETEFAEKRRGEKS